MEDLEDSKNLIESPLYNLSLSSLENFHSAFLAWIGKEYTKEFLAVFKDCFQPSEQSTEKETAMWEQFKYIFDETVTANDIDCITQSREGANNIIDIKITIFKDEKKPKGQKEPKEPKKPKEANIYIENKLKSYPSQEQIDKYNEKFAKNKKNNKIILLCLVNNSNIKNCLTQDYTLLYKNLKEIFGNEFKYKNGYHKLLIKDYIEIIGEISAEFEKKCDSKNELKYDFVNTKENLNIKFEKCYELKNIYIKYRGNELAEYLKENIKNSSVYNIKNRFNHGNAAIDINLLYIPKIREFDLKNKEYDYSEHFTLGIQIERGQYRHYIIFPKSITSAELQEKKAQEILFNEKFENLWFIKMEQPPKKPRKDSCYTKFYGYRKDKECNFIYLHRPIGENKSYEKLLEEIKSDKDTLEKNQDKIIEILKELRI